MRTMKTDKGAIEVREEVISAMEPLLISESSSLHTALVDLAFELL